MPVFASVPFISLYAQDFHSPLSLSITFDQWPEESSWDIRIGDSTVVYSADYQLFNDDSDNTSLIINDLHLVPANGYYFNFYDAFIDGICCIQGDGSFSLSDANGAIVLTGGEFEVKESITFDVGGDLCANGLKDNGETEIDCGGECPPCLGGCFNEQAHNFDLDAALDDGSCLTCNDGIQNGDEIGVDCGGILCTPCLSKCPEDNFTTSVEMTTFKSISVNKSIILKHKIHSNITVEFTAGQEIVFNEGFEIDTNSILIADIRGCLE